MKQFHLSIGVKSLKESAHFFEHVLGAKITYGDFTDFININLFGNQLSLNKNPNINPNLVDFHFGINLPLKEFQNLEQDISKHHSKWIHSPLTVVDEGTEMERQKIDLKCPSGYLIQIKGYSNLRDIQKMKKVIEAADKFNKKEEIWVPN